MSGELSAGAAVGRCPASLEEIVARDEHPPLCPGCGLHAAVHRRERRERLDDHTVTVEGAAAAEEYYAMLRWPAS